MVLLSFAGDLWSLAGGLKLFAGGLWLLARNLGLFADGLLSFVLVYGSACVGNYVYKSVHVN